MYICVLIINLNIDCFNMIFWDLIWLHHLAVCGTIQPHRMPHQYCRRGKQTDPTASCMTWPLTDLTLPTTDHSPYHLPGGWRLPHPTAYQKIASLTTRCRTHLNPPANPSIAPWVMDRQQTSEPSSIPLSQMASPSLFAHFFILLLKDFF